MLRDDNQGHYGYIQTKEVPLTQQVNDSPQGEGLLPVLGKMVVGAVAMYVGGRMLRNGAATLMDAAGDLVKSGEKYGGGISTLMGVLKNRLDDFAQIDQFLQKAEGVASWTDDIGNKQTISMIDLLHGDDERVGLEYLKRKAFSSAAAAARALPYEIPAAYVTNRLFLDRQRLKEDIQNGMLDPRNPVDWIGDFAYQGAKYATQDLLMRNAGDIAYAAHSQLKATTPLYNAASYAIKRINSENLKWLSIQTEKMGLVGEAAQSSLHYADVTITAKPTDIEPPQDLSLLRAGIRKVNPFSSSTMERYSIAAKRFIDHDLPKVMNQHAQIGTREGSQWLEGRVATNARAFAEQFAVKRDASDNIIGFGTQGTGELQQMYNARLRDRLVEAGMTPKAAEELITINLGRSRERLISSHIISRAKMGDELGEAAVAPELKASQMFRRQMIDEKPWQTEAHEVLHIKGLDSTGITQEKFISAMQEAIPGVKEAQQWRDVAAKRVEEIREKALVDVAQRSAAKFRLPSKAVLASSVEEREYMSQRVLAELGMPNMAYRSADAFGKAKTILGAQTDDEAYGLLRSISRRRGLSYEGPLDQFNILGLRRATVAEAREIDLSDVRKGDIGKHASVLDTGNRQMREGVKSGLSEWREYLGHRRVGDMNADPGLFVSISGKVVDFRTAIKGAKDAVKFIDSSIKLPILQFKPTQLLGVKSFLDAADAPRYKYIPGGRNVFAFQEDETLDRFSPTAFIGRTGYMRTREGELKSIGDWNVLANDSRAIATKNARTLSGYPRTPVRTPEQQRAGVFGGKPIEIPGLKYTISGVEIETPSVSIPTAWLDIDQDTTGSIGHRASARINRSVNIKAYVAQTQWFKNLTEKSSLAKKIADRLGMDGTADAANPDFLLHRWQKYMDVYQEALDQKAGTSAASREAAAAKSAKKAMESGPQFIKIKGNVAEQARQAAEEAGGRTRASTRQEVVSVLEHQYSPQSNDLLSITIANSLRQHDVGITFGGAPEGNVDSLRRAVARINDIHADTAILSPTQRSSLQSFVESINSGATRDLSSMSARSSLHSKINSFYMQVAAMASGEDGEILLSDIEKTIETMQARGTIADRHLADQMMASVAAARLRLVDTGGDVVSKIDYGKTIGVSVPSSLKRIAGPSLSAGLRDVKDSVFGSADLYREAGTHGDMASGIKGLANVYRYTFGNQNWKYGEFLSDEDLPHSINPFAGSKWIAIRPLDRGLGYTEGLRDFGNMIQGRTEQNRRPEGNVFRTAKGSLLGIKGGEVNTGTIAGMHAVSRVAEVFESIGVGLDLSKYTSPVDLLARGIMGKRAVPIYGAVLAGGLLMGTPGIGKKGVIGAGAWAVGPGAGHARAALFQATGANEFFKTAADVMSLDEEARLRKWGRNYEEENQYWDTGVVPIRAGRFWLLGTHPYKGTKVDYYRPNWYRMFTSDYQYTDQDRGSRLEYAAFGTDLSPLKYLDPYHYERKWKEDRPYPISGDLFTGPWGPITGVLNMTVGNVLKPKIKMHGDLEQEYKDALVRSVIQANDMPADKQQAIAIAYKSGKLKVGDLMSYGVGVGPGGSEQSVTNINRATSGLPATGVTDYGVGNRSVSQRQAIGPARPGSISVDQTRDGSIIAAYNRFIQAKSGSKVVSLGNGNNGTMDPALGMPLLAPRRYDFDVQNVVVPSQTITGNELGYRLGDLSYHTQEWMGIYGFGVGTFTGGSHSPQQPMLQSADRGYGLERAFWDLDLGGFGDVLAPWRINLQASEITRRFLPHRRHDIQEYNPIPNTMPDWLPAEDYMTNFLQGDPYLKVKLGEARLPGAGYEKLNQLHPDAFGSYGAFDRFKILADVAPYSREYMYYRDLLAKSDLDPELKRQAADIKRQVAERKKKVVLHPRKWDGNLEKMTEGGLDQVMGDPNLFSVEGVDGPVRLAGVRFSKSPDGIAAAQQFYKDYISGRNVKIYQDSEHPGQEKNREKTYDVIAKVGGRNLNDILADKAKRGVPGITYAQSTSYVDSIVKYGATWSHIGKLWEAVAHADIPFKNKILLKNTADEYYTRKQVYGKTWQPWETPIQSYLRPFVESTTRPGRGIAGPLIGGTALGLLAGAFIDGAERPGLRKFTQIAGAVVGATIATFRMFQSVVHHQLWVPERRRREWAVDEYADILNYVKWSNLYEKTRQQALREEGVDPEQYIQDLKAGGSAIKQQFQADWDNAPVGGKPNKPMSEKSLESLGPITAMAIEFRKRRQGTMYGADVNSMDDTMYALPKRYRDMFNDLANTPTSKQKKLLDQMPRLMRRIFEAKWGFNVEKKPELGEYFKKHEMPNPDWEGWLPEVSLDEVKVKIIKHEGLDTAEFGLFPTQVNTAMAAPWAYPEYRSGTAMSKTDIEAYLRDMGVRDASVEINYGPSLAGFDMHLTHDRRMELKDAIQRQVSSHA